MIKISIVNRKGGTGKTTVSLSLSAMLNKKGYSTLLIDCDDQTDLSRTLFNQDSTLGIKEVFEGICSIEDILYWHDNEKFLFTLGSKELNYFEYAGDEKLFENILASEYLSNVDFVIFDNPPSISEASLQALLVSDYAIIVTDLDRYSLDNIQEMVDDILAIKEKWNSSLDVLGIVANKFDSRRNQNKANLNDLRNVMNQYIFNTHIGNYTTIPYSQSIGETITNVKWSPVTKQFAELTEEVISRINKKGRCFYE